MITMMTIMMLMMMMMIMTIMMAMMMRQLTSGVAPMPARLMTSDIGQLKREKLRRIMMMKMAIMKMTMKY